MEQLLLTAKKEYTEQLTDAVAPHLLDIVDDMWARADRRTRAFQRSLQEATAWNANVVKSHVHAIESTSPWLDDLIAATFLAYVKVMSSIKLQNQAPTIKLKVPTTDAFVHKVFVKLAKRYYEAPDLVRRASRSRTDAYALVRGAVESAVRSMLPHADLLRAYIGGEVDDNNTFSPTPGTAAGAEDKGDEGDSPEAEAGAAGAGAAGATDSPGTFDDAFRQGGGGGVGQAAQGGAGFGEPDNVHAALFGGGGGGGLPDSQSGGGQPYGGAPDAPAPPPPPAYPQPYPQPSPDPAQTQPMAFGQSTRTVALGGPLGGPGMPVMAGSPMAGSPMAGSPLAGSPMAGSPVAGGFHAPPPRAHHHHHHAHQDDAALFSDAEDDLAA